MPRRFLLAASLLCALATCVCASPLNVLLITADDMGLQLGCYGDKAIDTPHLDQLAREGRVFDNAYVAQASCSPSRSAMFTGLYPHANGQYGLLNAGVGFQLHEPLRRRTLPALLKRFGYRTGIIGKLHVGPEKSFPFDARLRVNTRIVAEVAEKAGEFMRDRPGGRESRFFLMVNYSDPHVMGRSPQPPKEAFPSQYRGVPAKPKKVGEVPPLPFQGIDDPREIKRTTEYYNACMRFDAGVGMLLEQLDASGHREDTLTLFVSDHGPPFFRGKTSCYEGGVKVPMIARWPGVFESGDRTDALVSTVDLLPTIMDAAEGGVPTGLHGMSLRHTLDVSRHRKLLATEFHYHGSAPFFPRRSIRDMRYKLIHNLRAGELKPPSAIDGDAALALSRKPRFAGTEMAKAFERSANPPEFELFDLSDDPWEFRDLSADAEHAVTLARLKKALLAWRQATDDPLLTSEGARTIGRFEKVKKKK